MNGGKEGACLDTRRRQGQRMSQKTHGAVSATWSSIVACASLAACMVSPTSVLEPRRIPYNERVLPVIPASVSEAFGAAVFVSKRGDRLPYRLLTPQRSRDTGLFPLVVVMHGSGAIGTDNVGQMGSFAAAWAHPELREEFPSYVVVPQVPARTADYILDTDSLQAAISGEALQDVEDLVEYLSTQLNVDPNRVYITGFSMGASAALLESTILPRRYAAVVAFAGIPPRRNLAPQAWPVPVLLVHGDQDEENPMHAALAWAQALRAAGGHPKVTVYEGMDHRVPPDMLTDTSWRQWLFRQRLSHREPAIALKSTQPIAAPQ